MFMMIKFDPHKGNSIPAGLQMFACNADWHQRLPDNYGDEGEDDHAEVHDEEDADSAGVVDAEVSPIRMMIMLMNMALLMIYDKNNDDTQVLVLVMIGHCMPLRHLSL